MNPWKPWKELDIKNPLSKQILAAYKEGGYVVCWPDNKGIGYSSINGELKVTPDYFMPIPDRPQKKEGWIVIYASNMKFKYCENTIFETKNEALSTVYEYCENTRIIRIEWEE